MKGVSLRDFLQSQIDNLARLVEVQRISSDEKVDTATKALDQRLEGMNEFRTQINSERHTYVTRSEIDLMMEKVMAELRPTQDRSVWLTGGMAALGVVLAIGLAVAAMLVNIFK
jgi:hypothetical protein